MLAWLFRTKSDTSHELSSPIESPRPRRGRVSKTLVLVVAAETLASINGDDKGMVNPRLSDRGVYESQRLKPKVFLSVPKDAEYVLVSSPMRAAKETAKSLMADRTPAQYFIDTDIRGRRRSGDASTFLETETAVKHDESEAAFKQRCRAFYDSLQLRFEAWPTIVVVTHADVAECLVDVVCDGASVQMRPGEHVVLHCKFDQEDVHDFGAQSPTTRPSRV